MANYVKFFISIFGVILLLGIPEHAKAEKVYSSNIVVLSEREIIIDTSYEKKIDNSVDLKLINTGREAWSKEKIRLSYHLINKNNEVVLNDGARTLLPQDIKPGGYINIKPNIEIPSNLELNEQLYIQFDLVSEGEMWFSEVDKKNSIVLPIKFIKNYDFEILNPVKSISVWGKEKNKLN
ncbi:hypothetical protein VQ056_25055 [Paenibacillus sp. JTLBN-2024]